MKKMKLGELVINRKAWVRERTSLDHIRCLVNDLINGAKFPPLKVDRETGIIVGGVHRYEAYKLFYGNGWEDREIEIDFLDLPPFEEDPAAWYAAALEDNEHLAERLGYGDRNKTAANILKAVSDPESSEALELARLLKFTPEGWREYANIVFGPAAVPELSEKAEAEQAATAEPKKYKKAPTNDIQAGRPEMSPNVRVQSAARRLSALAEENLEYLSPETRGILQETAEKVLELLG